MELIIGIVFIAVVGYLVLSRKKPEVVQEIVEEVKAVEKKAEVVIAKVEEEVKTEVVAVAKKAKATATKAKAKAVEVEQEVVAAVKKARKPRAPKA
jgi:C4-dicarboxylate transporter